MGFSATLRLCVKNSCEVVRDRWSSGNHGQLAVGYSKQNRTSRSLSCGVICATCWFQRGWWCCLPPRFPVSEQIIHRLPPHTGKGQLRTGFAMDARRKVGKLGVRHRGNARIGWSPGTGSGTAFENSKGRKFYLVDSGQEIQGVRFRPGETGRQPDHPRPGSPYDSQHLPIYDDPGSSKATPPFSSN